MTFIERLSPIILYPLTHRMITEAWLTANTVMQSDMLGALTHARQLALPAPSAQPAPVKAKRVRKAKTEPAPQYGNGVHILRKD